MKIYQFFNDGEYVGDSELIGRMPHNSTKIAPPPLPWDHVWPFFEEGRWIMKEDYRERNVQLVGEELVQEATDYWLPEDDWQSLPRKMTKPGPLPDGALLERPERPASELLDEAKARKIDEITQGYDAAMAASITMPAMQDPSATDIVVNAALFAAEDAEGLEFISQTHAETRDSLTGMVREAETVEEVEEITVSYAV